MDNTIHRINHYPVINIRKTDCAIQRIEIYPIDSVIHLVNIWGQFNIFMSHHHFERVGRRKKERSRKILTENPTHESRRNSNLSSQFWTQKLLCKDQGCKGSWLTVDSIISFEWHRVINWESCDFFFSITGQLLLNQNGLSCKSHGWPG